jgi:formylglycine-generating enzyme required for sulfatase activity
MRQEDDSEVLMAAPAIDTPTQLAVTAPTQAAASSQIPTTAPTAIGTELFEMTATQSAPDAPTTTSDLLQEDITRISPVDGMTLVYVPAGAFPMGTSGEQIEFLLAEYPEWNMKKEYFLDEQPQQTVYLDAFWIDRTEVTSAMYAAFLNTVDTETRTGVWMDSSEEDWVHLIRRAGRWQPREGYEEHPVNAITWYGAQAYCEWAERRLPTEAEWEKAARGTDGRTFPWGEGIDCQRTNIYSCTDYRDTRVVHSLSRGASPYGALNMAGNVREWVADWYDATYYAVSPPANPAGPD